MPTGYNRPPSASRKSGHELVGAARGVGADQRPAPAPVGLGHLGQGRLGGRDVIGSGVAHGVSGPEQTGHRLAGPARPVVEETNSSSELCFSRRSPRWPTLPPAPTTTRRSPRESTTPRPSSLHCPTPSGRALRDAPRRQLLPTTNPDHALTKVVGAPPITAIKCGSWLRAASDSDIFRLPLTVLR